MSDPINLTQASIDRDQAVEAIRSLAALRDEHIALRAENARLRTLNDAYWAECEAWRSVPKYAMNTLLFEPSMSGEPHSEHGRTVSRARHATDDARRVAGLETA